MGQAVYQLNQLPPLLLLGLWPQDPAVTESNLQEQGAPRAIKRLQSPYARPVYIWVSPTLWQVGSASPSPSCVGLLPAQGWCCWRKYLLLWPGCSGFPPQAFGGGSGSLAPAVFSPLFPCRVLLVGKRLEMCQVMHSAQVAMTVRGRAWPELAVFSRAWPSLQPRQCRWQQPGLGATAM